MKHNKKKLIYKKPYKKYFKTFFSLIDKKKSMELKVKVHLNDNVEHDKEVIDRLVETNLNSKISGYLKKYENKEDAEGSLELKIEKNKKGLFNGKLIANLDSDEFIFEREDYDNLDDLINNLFKHLKEDLSSCRSC